MVQFWDQFDQTPLVAVSFLSRFDGDSESHDIAHHQWFPSLDKEELRAGHSHGLSATERWPASPPLSA